MGKILTGFEGEIIQEWLERHGPFDAVIDGANVGLINQHDFSFIQVIYLEVHSINSYITSSLESTFSVFVLMSTECYLLIAAQKDRLSNASSESFKENATHNFA